MGKIYAQTHRKFNRLNTIEIEKISFAQDMSNQKLLTN